MSRDGFLPPGVEEYHIPGNRPEDVKYEKWYESLTTEELTGYTLEWLGKEEISKRIAVYILEGYWSVTASSNFTKWLDETFNEFLSEKYTKGGK